MKHRVNWIGDKRQRWDSRKPTEVEDRRCPFHGPAQSMLKKKKTKKTKKKKKPKKKQSQRATVPPRTRKQWGGTRRDEETQKQRRITATGRFPKPSSSQQKMTWWQCHFLVETFFLVEPLSRVSLPSGLKLLPLLAPPPPPPPPPPSLALALHFVRDICDAAIANVTTSIKYSNRIHWPDLNRQRVQQQFQRDQHHFEMISSKIIQSMTRCVWLSNGHLLVWLFVNPKLTSLIIVDYRWLSIGFTVLTATLNSIQLES